MVRHLGNPQKWARQGRYRTPRRGSARPFRVGPLATVGGLGKARRLRSGPIGEAALREEVIHGNWYMYEVAAVEQRTWLHLQQQPKQGPPPALRPTAGRFFGVRHGLSGNVEALAGASAHSPRREPWDRLDTRFAQPRRGERYHPTSPFAPSGLASSHTPEPHGSRRGLSSSPSYAVVGHFQLFLASDGAW